MLRNLLALTVLALLAFLLLGVAAPDEALAGPGGQIAKAIFKTWWGRVIVAVLAIIFLPLILYVFGRQWLAARATKRDLNRLAEKYPLFGWERIEKRLRLVVPAVYKAWGRGDIGAAGDYVTGGFYEGQQGILDRWAEEGRRNVCRLKKVRKMNPLWLHVEDDESPSIVQVLISLDLIDYLIEERSKKVVKGKKDKVIVDHDVIWTLVQADDEWLLHSIEDGDQSLIVASQKNVVSTTWLDRQCARREGVASGAPPLDAPADVPTADEEESVVDVGDDQQRD